MRQKGGEGENSISAASVGSTTMTVDSTFTSRGTMARFRSSSAGFFPRCLKSVSSSQALASSAARTPDGDHSRVPSNCVHQISPDVWCLSRKCWNKLKMNLVVARILTFAEAIFSRRSSHWLPSNRSTSANPNFDCASRTEKRSLPSCCILPFGAQFI
ncbi:unnamed protein product [Victoria cruziana]